MSKRGVATSIVASIAATIVAAQAVSAAVGASTSISVTSPNAPAQVSPACTTSQQSAQACHTVIRFFQLVGERHFAAACALLGARLRSETGGGAACPRGLSYAYFREQAPWAIVGVRRTGATPGVLVRLPMPELDHYLQRTWLAVVGVEHGRSCIVSTRLLG
jgi:hypothetical protein